MATVFISYARDDLVAVTAVERELSGAGLTAWRDLRQLQPGVDVAAEITRAIRECDAFLLLLSRASSRSDYVSSEVAIAHHFRKPIVPVQVEPSTPADSILPYIVRLQRWPLADGASGLAAHLAERLSVRADAARKTSTPGEPRLEIAGRFVSNDDYDAFLRATHRRRPSQSRAETGSDPVTRVSWDDAVACCDWMGGRLPAASSDVRPAASSPDLGEWWDAGTEQHKHVRNPATLELTTVVERTARSPNVTFRCLPARAAPPRTWAHIDGGRFTLGCDAGELTRIAELHRLPSARRRPILARAATAYNLRGFVISTTCITNHDYFAFTRATGRQWPQHWDARWLARSGMPFPSRLASQPVVNVGAADAVAFAGWAKGWLPTWLEWERAARGPERRAYPWGGEYDARRCNSVESERGSVAEVDEYPSGDSPEGARQMCGNVAEWVVGPQGEFEQRGGSHRLPCELWGLVYAFRGADAGEPSPDVGFRVVSN